MGQITYYICDWCGKQSELDDLTSTYYFRQNSFTKKCTINIFPEEKDICSKCQSYLVKKTQECYKQCKKDCSNQEKNNESSNR